MDDKFLNMCKPKSYIYPSAYARFYKISEQDMYKILEKYKKEGILKNVYHFCCPSCNHAVDNYESLGSIDDYVYCQHCDEEFSRDEVMKYIQVIYRKV